MLKFSVSKIHFLFEWGLVVLLGSLLSCELSREYDGELFPTSSPKLVCNASIGNETPISVYLFPTQQVLDTSAANFLPNASVDLYRNGTFFETLFFQTNKYVSSTAHQAKPGDVYQIKISSADYPELISSLKKIPSIPTIEENRWLYNADSSKITATIIFRDSTLNPNGYALFADLYAGQTLIRSGVIGETTTEPIYLDENTIQRDITVRTQVTIFDQFIPVDTIIIDRIKISVRSISEDYYIYNASIPDGEIGGFFPPQDTLFTNFTGGYGVFYTHSISSIWIER